jgi:hydroxypyruvate isomerase
VADNASALRFDANLAWLFTELPFQERFAAAAAAGFAAVEFPSPYDWIAERLREQLDASGLHQVLINSPVGEPGSPTQAGLACLPDRVDEFRRGVETGLRYAEALGSDFLHLVGGARPPELDRDRAFAQYVTNVGWAADAARGTGVRLLLEMQNQRAVPGFILESQEQAVDVIEAVASPHVGLLFDAYHQQMQGGRLIDTATAAWPHIFHIQIADVPGRHEPGTGEIGWPMLFEFLERSGYAGWIGCEYSPAGMTEQGLTWIDEWSRRKAGV